MKQKTAPKVTFFAGNVIVGLPARGYHQVAGLGFFLPGIGALFIFINTIGSVPWCLLMVRYLFKMAKESETQ